MLDEASSYKTSFATRFGDEVQPWRSLVAHDQVVDKQVAVGINQIELCLKLILACLNGEHLVINSIYGDFREIGWLEFVFKIELGKGVIKFETC